MVAEHIGQLDASWQAAIGEELNKPYMLSLRDFLKQEKAAGKIIYPPSPLIFNAFNKTPFDKVRVVIIGQDPYHGPDQAHGLSFSVPKGVALPPSLKNIFKEIEKDINKGRPTNTTLENWANQGVLLLNAGLTVREDLPNSHKQLPWGTFTDAVIQKLSDEKEGLVFLLWGSFAHKKGSKINREKHLVLECGHPSPLSANQGKWFGNKHFSKTNVFLESKGLGPIHWLNL